MDICIGIGLVIVLLAGFVAARLAYRRDKLRRRRMRRAGAFEDIRASTARSDMRAFEDPSVVMDTVRRPGARKAPSRDGTDHRS